MAIDKKLIDQLLTDYKKPEDISGESGLLKELTKAILERALEAEMTSSVTNSKRTLPPNWIKRRIAISSLGLVITHLVITPVGNYSCW
jgi:transposase-like protein